MLTLSYGIYQNSKSILGKEALLYIPTNMHGTHEHTKGIRPAGLTKFAITNTDYRAFDIYNADDFTQEIIDSGFNRNELWLQIKETRTNFYDSYSPNRPSIEETFNLNLAVLGTNYIDSYAAWLVDENSKYQFSKNSLKKWEQLEELYREGKVNYIGFEHLEHIDHLEEIYNNAKIKPIILHLSTFSPEVLKYCLENGIVFQYFGISGAIKNSHNAIITNIAQTHNVSVKQIFMKLLTELGVQPLTGGNSEKYLKENANLNFELSADEIKQLIESGIFGEKAFNEHLVDSFPLMERNTKQMLAIYEDLQNGVLVKKNDIVTRLSNCSTEQLSSELEKLAHYIPKIDPTSLTNIITNQSPVIIDYLKQYGANFAEITSNSYTKIIDAYGVDHIPILQEKLDIPVEKLLLASLNAEDASYFNQLFVTADLNKIIRHDIVAIVKAYPETLEKFIYTNIAPEILLMSATAIGDKATFDDLVAKCDINKLYGIEVTEIIIQFGPQVIKQLVGYHFYRLTITDLDKIAGSLGIDAIKELVNYNVSPNILLPALKLGGVELFNELVQKVDITKLDYVKYIKQVIKLGGEQILDTLIEYSIPTELLLSFAISEENGISLLNKIIAKVDLSNINPYSTISCIKYLINTNNNERFQILAKSKMNFSKIELHTLKDLIDEVVKSNKPEWLQKLIKAGIDITKLEGYYKASIINNVIDINKFEWFQEFAKANIDITKLEEYNKVTIINHIIDINKPQILLKLAEIGIDLTKLNSSTISNIINHIIDINKPEWFQKLEKSGIDLTSLDSSYDKVKIIEKIIDNDIPEWFQIFSEYSIDLTNIDGYYKKDIVNHIIDINKPEWLQELNKTKINLVAIESYNQVRIIEKIIDSDKPEWFQILYNSGIDLTKLEGYNQKDIITHIIDINKPEWFQRLVEANIINISKLDGFEFRDITNKLIDANKIEWFQKFVEDKIIDLTKLMPFLIIEVTHNTLKTKQFEWIKTLADAKLDFSKAKTQDKLFIAQLEKCHSDTQCYSECFIQEADITHYNSECIGKFAFSDNEL